MLDKIKNDVFVEDTKYLFKYKEINEEELEELTQDKSIVVKNISFPSLDDAKEYANDILKDNGLVVKFQKVEFNFEETDISKELQGKIEVLNQEIQDFPKYILEKLKEQKSGSKGCSNCKSSINKDYLVKNIESFILHIANHGIELPNEEVQKLLMGSLNCPICGNKDYSVNETDKKKYDGLQAKAESLDETYSTTQENYYKNANKKDAYLYVKPE